VVLPEEPLVVDPVEFVLPLVLPEVLLPDPVLFLLVPEVVDDVAPEVLPLLVPDVEDDVVPEVLLLSIEPDVELLVVPEVLLLSIEPDVEPLVVPEVLPLSMEPDVEPLVVPEVLPLLESALLLPLVDEVVPEVLPLLLFPPPELSLELQLRLQMLSTPKRTTMIFPLEILFTTLKAILFFIVFCLFSFNLFPWYNHPEKKTSTL
jgi:hypothetical protein